MIALTAADTHGNENGDGLRAAFASSAEYLDAVFAKTNPDAKRQSLAGLRALLFLLRVSGVDPSPLILARAAGGKPYFTNAPLRFCISHSAGLAVCALSETDVGVDVETVRAKKNVENLAKRFFSPAECDIITLAKDKNDAFFEIWTKKEASLKLRGRGIDRPLAEVDTVGSSFTVFDVTAADGDYIVSVAGGDTVRIFGGLEWKKRKQ